MALICRERFSASLGIACLFGVVASQVFADADGQMETSGAPYATVSGGWAYFPNMSKANTEARTSFTSKQGNTETKSAALTVMQVDLQFGLGFDVAVGGAVGYDFGSFRVEGEVSHASADFKSKATHIGYSYPEGDDGLRTPKLEELPDGYSSEMDGLRLAATRLLANVYYDVETGTRFRPYAGIGAGAAHLSVSPLFGSGWALAFQGLAGLGVELVEGVDIRLGYRILGTTGSSLEAKVNSATRGQEELTDTGSVSNTMLFTMTLPIALIHQVELGVRYSY